MNRRYDWTDPEMMDAPLLIEMAMPGGSFAGLEVAPRTTHYVVGVENQLLLAVLRRLLPAWNVGVHAVDAVASLPFNPLVLIGPTGVGKTALIEQAVLQRARTWKSTASEWGRAYQEALVTDQLQTWRGSFESYELVVIEDLDRTMLSDNAQHELRLAIDAAIDRNAQFVVTAQRQPGQWHGLTAGLRDRLACGLTIPLRYPSRESRRILLELAAKERGLSFTPIEFDRILDATEGSPRVLYGALTSLDASRAAIAASKSVEGQRTGLEVSRRSTRRSTARETAKSLAGDPTNSASGYDIRTLKQLIAAAARYFSVSAAALTGVSRRKSIVHARGIAIHVIRLVTHSSYARIGDAFGGRDHTTILHADRRIVRIAETDSSTASAIGELRQILGSY